MEGRAEGWQLVKYEALHTAMMTAAVTAGMPGRDASCAAANAIMGMREAIAESVEAREALGRGYVANERHVEAMMREVDLSCRGAG